MFISVQSFKDSKHALLRLLKLYSNIAGLSCRDKTCARDDFVFYSQRLMRILIEKAMSLLPFKVSCKSYVITSLFSLFQWGGGGGNANTNIMQTIANAVTEFLFCKAVTPSN